MQGIRVEKLFGHFDYTISFSEEGMTIITGPNGFGKSTLLRIINALADSDMDYFFDLKFEEIEILEADGDENLLIRKEEERLSVDGVAFDRQDFASWNKYELRRTLEEQPQEQTALLMSRITDIVFAFQRIAGEVYSIEEQRLVRSVLRRKINRTDGKKVFERKIIQTVEEIPDKLKKEISIAAGEYSQISSELDSTFPQRLFAQTEGLTREEFDRELSSMGEKLTKLQKYEISSFTASADVQFKEEDARALKVYFDDFQRKYEKYDRLLEQLELFENVVNKRFRFKKVYISMQEGIWIADEEGDEIPLLRLSSGEKEILVLFYQLIFEVPEGSLLLVDEPEISLHIAWQRMFAEDMQTIVRRKGIKAVIATHSVQIVNGNSTVQRDLGKQYAERLHKR